MRFQFGTHRIVAQLDQLDATFLRHGIAPVGQRRSNKVMTERKSIIGWHSYSRWFLCSAAILAAAQTGEAQPGILGSNLIVNGNAEAGAAGTATTTVASISGWTRATGNANVLPYNLTGYILLSDPAPPDHGFQYFNGAINNNSSTLTQIINVSSGASIISGGNVRFTASAYLGGTADFDYTAQMTVAFQNASGQTFSSATVGPMRNPIPAPGMSLQQQIGLVPSGTVLIAVTLTLEGLYSAADSLSLELATVGTSPSSVLGANLIVNGGAETGPSVAAPAVTLFVPGWSTAEGFSVTPYGGVGWIQTSDPGPPDRGVNLFWGGVGVGSMYQDIDVSPAASLVDSGQVTYQVSAWLGGLLGSSPILTYTFFDWASNQLAPTAQLGPASHSGTALVDTSHSGALPSGTRRVRISLSLTSGDDFADDIAFTLIAPGAPPVITPGGIVSASAFGGFTAIAPGSWIEIYGSNLAPGTSNWTSAEFNNGVAPTSLGGVSVSIGGAPAFIDYVSPGQIDALVPSNAPTGAQELTVTNANGVSDGFGIIVNQTEPGLLAPFAAIGGKQYVGALLPDGTFALPANAVSGVASRPAIVGENLTIYGVGFGPVTPGVTAGTLVTQLNSLTTPFQFLFGSTQATVTYYGLAPSFTGLYQFDVTVPSVSANAAEPISITLGGVKGSQTLYIAVQN
jgi:uncharacterized protein (TIGR03437 family)